MRPLFAAHASTLEVEEVMIAQGNFSLNGLQSSLGMKVF